LEGPIQQKLRGTLEERIAAYSHREPSGCWIWDGTLNEHGYGVIGYRGRMRRVHRITYRLAYGDDALPEGWHIDHFVCRTPRCIEPEHLRALPQSGHSRHHYGERLIGPDGRLLPKT
jgi:hypothetical protein